MNWACLDFTPLRKEVELYDTLSNTMLLNFDWFTDANYFFVTKFIAGELAF